MAVDGQLETQNRAGSPCTRLLPSLQTSAFSAAMGICDTEKSSQNCRYQEVGKSQWVEMNSGCPIQQIPGRQRLQDTRRRGGLRISNSGQQSWGRAGSSFQFSQMLGRQD